MDNIGLLIYLMSRVDPILEAAVPFMIFSLIGFVLLSVFYVMEEDFRPTIRPYKKACLWVSIISGIILLFTPNSATIAAMYLVPKLVDNQTVMAIPDKALKLLTFKLDEWSEDIVGKSKKDD